MTPDTPPVFVLLGRAGDIIQLLPCFDAIHRRSGARPIVIVSKDYANVFDGVSYVRPHPIREHWWQGVPVAKAVAREVYGGGQVVQSWHEPPKHDDTIGFRGTHVAVLQSHGYNHGVNMALDPCYSLSMVRRCGFSRAEWMQLHLRFDRRNPAREGKLAEPFMRGRPLLLFHTSGVSSPFTYTPELVNLLTARFSRYFKVVDLGRISAYRIYDLLGLMDRASFMVLSDSAPLHLAAGTQTPYVALTVDGWTSSVPKGNVQLEIKYSQFKQRIPELVERITSSQHELHDSHTPCKSGYCE